MNKTVMEMIFIHKIYERRFQEAIAYDRYYIKKRDVSTVSSQVGDGRDFLQYLLSKQLSDEVLSSVTETQIIDDEDPILGHVVLVYDANATFYIVTDNE